jgi:hypothetical protein
MSLQQRVSSRTSENADLLADSYNILNRWKNYFSQLLNVHSVTNVRQTDLHRPEPLVPDSNPYQSDIATAKLKKYKLISSKQISSELIETLSKTLLSMFHKLITSLWNKQELSDQCKGSIIVPIYKKGP